jgi:glycosyltransferase involved in cell wall biosynthesis
MANVQQKQFIGNFETVIPENLEIYPIIFSGWAFDTDGYSFSSISLFFGDFSFEAQLKIPRCDVKLEYPNFEESGISGYEVKVNLPVPKGSYRAKLIGTASSGKFCTLAEFDFIVNLAPLSLVMETPSIQEQEAGRIRFSGWCCHSQYRILELSILINGISYICQYGLERSDVASAHPDLTGSIFSGFEILISLPVGSYALQFNALLENGEIINFPIFRPLTIRNPYIWIFLYKKLKSLYEFVHFIRQKYNSWSVQNGALPSFSQVPRLVIKAIHMFRQRHVNAGEIFAPPLGFTVPNKESLYESWIKNNQWNARREFELKARLSDIKHSPLISVVMPVYNPPLKYLEISIESVVHQIYENWELCIADDCSTNLEVRTYLMNLAATDSRIKLMLREENGNISRATNSAANLATGEFMAFLDNDDELTPDALAEVALYLASHQDCDFLYSDDDKIDEAGNRFSPQFKPDWSPELLLSYMYFSHLCVVRSSLFNDIGGIRVGYEGSQDYDLALRATENARHVGHIPLILYHWRVLPGSTAQSGNAKPASIMAGLRAVQEAVDRRGINAKVYQPLWAESSGVGIFSLNFPNDGPLVTIIIPTKNSFEILKLCIESLKRTTYLNYNVLIIDNESDDPDTLRLMEQCGHRVIRIANPSGVFNYSYINNCAVKACDSDYVLFLNNDTEVNNPCWLSQMVGYARIQGVGAVGARLLYPDSRVQHAGIVHGYYKGMAGPACKLLPSWHNGYLSYAAVSRNYMAVTAACLLMPRKVFIDIGGFDESNFGVAYNDVDLCYRLVDKGLRCVYSAASELVHYEGYSRGYEDKPAEESAFKRKNLLRIDKYYNPNLSLESEQFEITPRAAERHIPVQPIRALMVAFNLNLEGAPYSQYELTEGLKRYGVINPVVYSPVDGPLRSLYEAAGIEVIVRPHPLRGVFKIQDYESSVNAFAEVLHGLGIQVVYGNTLQSFYAIDAAERLNLPSIWNPRESEPWQTYFANFGDPIALKALQCFTYPYQIVFVADATRRGCEELNSTNNFTTICNGLNLLRADNERVLYPRENSRVELGIRNDDLMVLLLGTVCERKGQIDLIFAIRELESTESLRRLRFFIVGDRKSAYSVQLHSLIEQLPKEVQDRVTVVEETKETAHYFSSADIFVCTSRVESYPRVILEAMYYGLAIVTTPVFGISEQLTNGISALFYTPGDPLQLAKQIKCLALNDVLRRQLATNAKLRLERLTNFDEMLRQYAACFIGAYYTKTPHGSSPIQKDGKIQHVVSTK